MNIRKKGNEAGTAQKEIKLRRDAGLGQRRVRDGRGCARERGRRVCRKRGAACLRNIVTKKTKKPFRVAREVRAAKEKKKGSPGSMSPIIKVWERGESVPVESGSRERVWENQMKGGGRRDGGMPK